jgi:hypothetical protein
MTFDHHAVLRIIAPPRPVLERGGRQLATVTRSISARVWLDAGFKSEQVDIKARKLVFRRVRGMKAKVEADEDFVLIASSYVPGRPSKDPASSLRPCANLGRP